MSQQAESLRRTSVDGGKSHPDLDRRIKALVDEIFEVADPDEKDDFEGSQQGLFYILETMQRVALKLVEQSLAMTDEQRQQILAP
jgi:hypothetical protein